MQTVRNQVLWKAETKLFTTWNFILAVGLISTAFSSLVYVFGEEHGLLSLTVAGN